MWVAAFKPRHEVRCFLGLQSLNDLGHDFFQHLLALKSQSIAHLGAYHIEWRSSDDVTSGASAELRISDGALIERVIGGEESALAALYDRYSGMLHSMLVRILRDTQAAEEVLQDVFFHLWNNAAKFDSARGSLPGWLLVSARNRAISRLRRRIPSEGDELQENAIALPFNLESSVAQQELLGKVRGALANLPEGQRQALELAYFEGMTHSEIAERTGEPLGTVKTRLRSAVETLKKTLQS